MISRLLFCALLLPALTDALAANEVYSTSFEASEPFASHREGAIISIERKHAGWTGMAKGRAEIMAAKPGGPTAPDGQQFLRLHQGATVYVHHTIAPSGHAIKEPFQFSVLAAFRGEMTGDSVAFQIAVTNWNKQAIYAGLQFGVMSQGGIYRFYWSLNLDQNKKSEWVPFGEEAQEDTVYRMEADIDPSSGNATLQVFDQATGQIVAKTDHARVYRGRPDSELGFNFLRINNNSSMEINFDAIKVSLNEP